MTSLASKDDFGLRLAEEDLVRAPGIFAFLFEDYMNVRASYNRLLATHTGLQGFDVS